MLLAQVAAAAALALVSLKGAQAAGRAEESMVFDGKQGDFSDLRPPAPGYIFITPRRVRENAEPMWFEFATSFSLDLWMRPQRLFLGTEIEGGVLTCLVTDAPLSRYSGFGIVVSGSDRKGKVIFRATQVCVCVCVLCVGVCGCVHMYVCVCVCVCE
jgi:hypothetical protein